MAECTFGRLREILRGLGYSNQDFGHAMLFEHAGASSRLLIDRFADAEPVEPLTLAMVGRNLDERGILPRARFEQLVRERSLAG